MTQASITTDFNKSHEQSITHDTTSVLIVLQPPIHILIDKIPKKLRCMWGRVLLVKMKKHNRQIIKDKGNLALAVASKMPPHIRDEVTKIVRYYEVNMEDQLLLIHKLVEENTKLRRIIQKNQDDKQNQPLFNDTGNQKAERVNQLENALMQKNKQIVSLNKEITDLLTKVKKYKKRVYELEYKSPIKDILQQE